MVNKRHQGFFYETSFKRGSGLVRHRGSFHETSFKLGVKPDKKAQMKIQQTAFMLLAITLFFVLVGLLILSFRFSGLKQNAAKLQEENAKLLVSKIANSPEFSCEEMFGKRKSNCIDEDKVMMLRQEINKYNGFWGVSGIKIRTIYPKQQNDVICTLFNYPNCNVIQLFGEDKGYGTSNFVSLCRKESSNESYNYNKCELAKIIVNYEGEQK